MKKLLLGVSLFIFASVNIAFARSYSIDEINHVKSVWKYGDGEANNMDTVRFGKWFQSDLNVEEDIEWYVLKKEKGKALLLSKNVLFGKKFHDTSYASFITWEDCSLRKWLNGIWYNFSFSDEEKGQILDSIISPDYNQANNSTPENDTIDKVFILSRTELYTYFQDSNGNYNHEKLNSHKTVAANNSGLFGNSFWVRTPAVYSDVFDNNKNVIKYYYGYCWSALFGDNTFSSMWVDTEDGVRPAIWISSDKLLFDEVIDYSLKNRSAQETTIMSLETTRRQETYRAQETIKKQTTNKTIIASSEGDDEIPTDNTYSGPGSKKNNKKETKDGWVGDRYYRRGQLATNEWIQYGSDWYYVGYDGMTVKSQWVGDYYVDVTGKMLKNTTTPDGKMVDATGKLIINNSLSNTNSTNGSNIQVPEGYALSLGMLVKLDDSNNSANTSSNKSNAQSDSNLSAQIKNVKLVTEYSADTTVDQMDTVTFGSYPQSDASGATKEPIEWIVLDRQGNKALLLSKYVLDRKYYNDINQDITWENCTLRYWLNSTFLNSAFTSDEQLHIETTNLINSNNIKYGTYGGNNTNDKIFCLNIEEIKKYFNQADIESGDKRVVTFVTNYVKNVDDIVATWCLRSPGQYQNQVAHVDFRGNLLEFGFNLTIDMIIRPALWVSY